MAHIFDCKSNKIVWKIIFMFSINYTCEIASPPMRLKTTGAGGSYCSNIFARLYDPN